MRGWKEREVHQVRFDSNQYVAQDADRDEEAVSPSLKTVPKRKK